MSQETHPLMVTRFEVIADYPDNARAIGTIITIDNKKPAEWQINHIEFFSRYPNLFKPLQWYERRELSEMPKYVKVAANGSIPEINVGEVFEIRSHMVSGLPEYCTLIGCDFTIHYKILEPATESDYTDYVNAKNQSKWNQKNQ